MPTAHAPRARACDLRRRARLPAPTARALTPLFPTAHIAQAIIDAGVAKLRSDIETQRKSTRAAADAQYEADLERFKKNRLEELAQEKARINREAQEADSQCKAEAERLVRGGGASSQ